MDNNYCKLIENKQQQTIVSPNRSILTDHTNTNLLDNARKRAHFLQTEKPISPPSSPKLSNKRPKQETPPPLTYRNSLFSLLKNPFSIFHLWNPIRDATPPTPAPQLAPHTRMQDPLHPIGTQVPTIKPWAYSNLKRDRDELSSLLSTPLRDSLSRTIFQPQTRTDKTLFKNDLFTRRQNDSYLDLLHSKAIPVENLTSTPKPRCVPTLPLPTDSVVDTMDEPSSARLSSFLYPLKPVALSSSRLSRLQTPEHTPRFKPPHSRLATRYSLPKYDKQLALQRSQAGTPVLPSPAGETARSFRIPAPHRDQTDVRIVSVDTPRPAVPCVLSIGPGDPLSIGPGDPLSIGPGDPLSTGSGDPLSDIVLLRNQFDLSRIKKEFEEEELTAYNRKLYLSNLERKQSAAAAAKQARPKEKASIDELKEKMERLVHTLETDIEDSNMPGPSYKPVELGEDTETRVSRALACNPIEEVLSSGFRLHIKRKDMSTLQPCQWLNDEIINFYCSLIAERSQQQRDKPLPTVHTFNTFFYTQLKDRGFDSVKRWTRKVDIFSLDVITVPIHLGMHWCMAIVDLRGKSIVYYDSFLGSNMKCLNLLFDYLQKEKLDKKREVLDITNWKLTHEKEIPEQKNSSDCGVFACQFAEFISRDAAINFTQEDMPCLRRQMVAEILDKKLYH